MRRADWHTLHQHGIYHQDIKPANLLLTNSGVRIIDFNIAVSDRDEETVSAGTSTYLPPDFNSTLEPSTTDKIDRDLYALAITFYECITGRYPFDEPNPPLGKSPRNPREIEGCEDLSEELVALMTRAIAPKRAERFASAAEFLEAIGSLPSLRKPAEHPEQNVEQLLPLATDEHDAQSQETPEPLVFEIETTEPSEATEALPPLVPSPEAWQQPQPIIKPLQPVISETGKARFNLFDAPFPTSQSQPNPDKPIVLDPIGLYDIPPGYISITTEVEWMRFFGISTSSYWIKGERLCDWAEAWLRAWNKTEAIAEIKQHPRVKLAALFHPVPVPEEWTNKQLLTLATRLNFYPQDNPIAHLLADITDDHQIWLAQPSIQNLAAWLAIQVPQECRILERVWQHQFKEHNLATYYQNEDKLLLLRRWLCIAAPVITELGKYPLLVPDFLTAEFDQYWEQQLYRTEAKDLEDLVPSNQPGMERIAELAYKVLSNRPNWITKVMETKLSAYFSHQQQVELSERQPPSQPQPLALEASPEQALTWAIESYLPFRRWEVVINQAPFEQRISNRLADSFVKWMLKHYPDMKIASVDHSNLNYSVASLVRNLCQESPVLWVVVDGLGWLDHLELLSFLTKNHKLAVVTSIQPRFSILPTKTEYAKWSLYAQLLPGPPDWVDNISKGFSMMGIGKRYTDEQVDKLYRDLSTKKYKLYCWDTVRLDNLYHNQKDWQNLYQVQRPHTLEGIARDINYCLQQYPAPDELRIVIASDHGQILGMTEKITHCPEELEPKGRMAIGKTDDSRFVVLERERYGLPHDISVVRGSASLGSFSYTANKHIIGSHGGLFPEEVVVGVSVLGKFVQRVAVLISCRGEGKPREPGEIEIIIDNPNSVPLTDLCLCINELLLNTVQPLDQIIPANNKKSFKVPILEWPELPPTHEGNCLPLSGELTFRFANAEAGSVALDSESAIVVNQIFSSGFDINEFF